MIQSTSYAAVCAILYEQKTLISHDCDVKDCI